MTIKQFLLPLAAVSAIICACGDDNSSTSAANENDIALPTTDTIPAATYGDSTADTSNTANTCINCTETSSTSTSDVNDSIQTATGPSSSSEISDKPVVTTSSSSIGPTSSQEIIEQPQTEAVVYQEADSDLKLTFAASGVSVENDNNSCVAVDSEQRNATISCAGNYYLSGTSGDFQVVVAASSDAKVYLYLNGLNLTSASDAPIYIQSADKVFFMLVDGKENKLADASDRTKAWNYTKNNSVKTDTTGAVIYAKEDITFKGNGSLTITGNYNNGIHTTNDLRIKDAPTIKVTAQNNAIKGKSSVNIEGGYYTLTTTKGDAIKSDEDDAESLANGKGSVEILGGEFTIKAADKGVKANNYILLADSVSTPVMNITAGTGTPNLSKSEGGMGGFGGGRPGQPGSNNNFNSSSSEDSSPKGFKADSNIYLYAGKITVNAEGNCVDGHHVFVKGGSYTLSGRRGLQAADTLHVAGGTVTTLNSYEGLEAIVIYMTGGITYTYASDDGWNATDKSGSDNCTNCVVNVTDGIHFVRVGTGDTDGIDSNGKIYISGGYVGVENMSSNGGTANVFDCGSCGGGMGGGMGRPGQQSSSTNSGDFLKGGYVVGFAGATELGTMYSMNYSSSDYYGTSNWACKPKGSGSKILSLQANPSSIDVNGMTAVDFGTTEASCYYKK